MLEISTPVAEERLGLDLAQHYRESDLYRHMPPCCPPLSYYIHLLTMYLVMLRSHMGLFGRQNTQAQAYYVGACEMNMVQNVACAGWVLQMVRASFHR
jgi:hypothetical protein